MSEKEERNRCFGHVAGFFTSVAIELASVDLTHAFCPYSLQYKINMTHY